MNVFSTMVTGIQWRDVVDITLNSYILFRLYVLFRRTNVFRVLIGIALLWFFQRIAVTLGLVLTSWAIQGITAATALIIIIVFRNEIRTVLQTKNLKTILWDITPPSRSEPVDVIVESVYELSHKKHGALIVIPGMDDLEEVVLGGINWQGVPSKEMLSSIFWPDNPVHDGAVIIRDGHVARVGAVLPLSRRKDFPVHLGTRHRAALGLAEATDALVLVVSEESGKVMAARKSRLIPVQDNLQLSRLLHEQLGDSDQSSGSGRKEKVRLAAAAFFAVLFVVSIWFSFTRGRYTLITIDRPIEFVNPAKKVEVYDVSANTVRLSLSGSATIIKSLDPDTVRVRIDLGKAKLGRNTFHILKDNITLPPGISLKRVSPTSVEATLDVPVQKVLPVQVDWIGKLPPGLRLVAVRVEPARVTVVGRRTNIAHLATIYTQKVSLNRLRTSGSLTLKLAPLPRGSEIYLKTKDQITVHFVIKQKEPQA